MIASAPICTCREFHVSELGRDTHYAVAMLGLEESWTVTEGCLIHGKKEPMRTIQIEAAVNGYIISEEGTFSSRKEVYTELADVFSELLLRFEGRSEHFSGDRYGGVAVFRVKEKSAVDGSVGGNVSTTEAKA